MSFDHALQQIQRNGGTVNGDEVTIICQRPVAVRYEKGFEGHYPVGRIHLNCPVAAMDTLTFEGIGIVFTGNVHSENGDYEAQLEMYIDGNPVETALLPSSPLTRRNDLCWKYQLPKGQHTVTFKWLNPEKNVFIHVGDALIYDDVPRKTTHP